MSNSLLDKIRSLSRIFQNGQKSGIDLYQLCDALSRILECSVIILDNRGHILGRADIYSSEMNSNKPMPEISSNLPAEYNSRLLEVHFTQANVSDIFNTGEETCTVTISPVYYGGNRLGTMIFKRINNEKFTEDDLVIIEYGIMVVAMEIMRIKMEKMGEDERKISMVEMAMGTLSYSELEAVEHVFRELNGNEGLLVASKIADREGITRSVIVNALRKLESAGIIESRSLGMKGTYIKILNDKLLSQLGKIQ
ncbi:MAG: GTP-sensing pleiotropic transcriptional regulator CodY [Clostridiales bacterium]|jgi:transcriptional pleiotropic repressor|nr:GTP-sensing pleiotropic transcriptional regulator CodY [Clostridiales bacterium]